MRAEIVAVGTELLLGDVVNGNTAWLGRALREIGIDVAQTAAVGDNVERIAGLLRQACERADAVLVTGGLGPTQDDVTREALASLTDVDMIRDPELETALRARYAATGRDDYPANNLRMADRPASARALANPAGTAPGLRVESGGALVFAMPGVPHEMVEIFDRWVRPELAERAGPGTTTLSRQLHTVGVWESDVAQALEAIDADLGANRAPGGPTLAYLASQDETLVRITAKAASAGQAQALVDGVEQRVRSALGDVIYGADLDTLPGVVFELLRVRGLTVACAESLTGGLLGGALSDPPGSSAVFLGGTVVYATAAKHSVLGVPATLLAERGAVDAEVAASMAERVRIVFGADYGIATTGVAGPALQENKAAGTLHVAVVGPAGAGGAVTRSLLLRGNRARVRHGGVQLALDVLRRHLLGLPVEASFARQPIAGSAISGTQPHAYTVTPATRND